MEILSRANWKARRVLVTGHTGFKGSWLTLWLRRLGAAVTGFALEPEHREGLFAAVEVGQLCQDLRGDIRSAQEVEDAVAQAKPEVIFHLAAQPLVRKSYEAPLETLSTNVMGTAHLLEAVRRLGRPCAVVVITSDKAYENREWPFAYRETDRVGGHDVYSMSKGASELVVSSYRRSFFPPEELLRHGVRVASARAGNVLGGGDWSADRLVPDAISALRQGRPIPVRSPRSVRPWQHVLEPLSGYLVLASRLLGADDPRPFCDAYNFGPPLNGAVSVGQLVEAVIRAWGEGKWEDHSDARAPHEAKILRLSVEKAFHELGWAPKWSLDRAVGAAVRWYKAQHEGASGADLRRIAEEQIAEYEAIEVEA